MVYEVLLDLNIESGQFECKVKRKEEEETLLFVRGLLCHHSLTSLFVSHDDIGVLGEDDNSSGTDSDKSSFCFPPSMKD